MSQGEVRKRIWSHNGKRKEAYQFTVTIDGKRTRRQFGSRAEAQEKLDKLKHPAATPAVIASITLGGAFDRYFKTKARKRSLAVDQRIAKHLRPSSVRRPRWPRSRPAASAPTRRSCSPSRSRAEAARSRRPRSTGRSRCCATCCASPVGNGSCLQPFP
jgi:hypothetical protein